MASQDVQLNFRSVEIDSFIRGFHEYRDVWQPVVGESLILKKEPTNNKDRLAVCVQKEGQIVGHVPRNLAPLFFHFLTRDVNKGFSTVSAAPVNRGPGVGMEVQCVYKLYSSSRYIEGITSLILEILPTTSVRDTCT